MPESMNSNGSRMLYPLGVPLGHGYGYQLCRHDVVAVESESCPYCKESDISDQNYLSPGNARGLRMVRESMLRAGLRV